MQHIPEEEVCPALFVATNNVLQALCSSVDVVTGAYALRNAPSLRAAMEEVHRVLKKGGTAAFLDFHRMDRLKAPLQYLIGWIWMSLWGLLLHGHTSHGYIADSLNQFPRR